MPHTLIVVHVDTVLSSPGFHSYVRSMEDQGLSLAEISKRNPRICFYPQASSYVDSYDDFFLAQLKLALIRHNATLLIMDHVPKDEMDHLGLGYWEDDAKALDTEKEKWEYVSTQITEGHIDHLLILGCKPTIEMPISASTCIIPYYTKDKRVVEAWYEMLSRPIDLNTRSGL